MKPLDDILFGVLIFFIIERSSRLVSSSVIEPFIESTTSQQNTVESWKLFAEVVFLLAACFVVYHFRGPLSRIIK